MVDVAAHPAGHYQILALSCTDKVYAVREADPFPVSVKQAAVLQLEELTFSDRFVDLVALEHEW